MFYEWFNLTTYENFDETEPDKSKCPVTTMTDWIDYKVYLRGATKGQKRNTFVPSSCVEKQKSDKL